MRRIATPAWATPAWLPGIAMLIAAVLCAASGGTRAQAVMNPAEATGFIETLASDTLAVLQSSEVPEAEKRDRVMALIERGFDLPLISRFVLGRFWNVASEDQLAEYQKLFTQSITRSYGRALVASGGTALEVQDSLMVSETDALVRTQLKRKDASDIGAAWRVRLVDGSPKIVDVLHEGVSMALTQRQEYASVIERQGIEGLLDLLRQRNS